MSDQARNPVDEQVPEARTATSAETPDTSMSSEQLDGLEDIDFLLEEIENKIAPLALA